MDFNMSQGFGIFGVRDRKALTNIGAKFLNPSQVINEFFRVQIINRDRQFNELPWVYEPLG
jgi:hypothetical protein